MQLHIKKAPLKRGSFYILDSIKPSLTSKLFCKSPNGNVFPTRQLLTTYSRVRLQPVIHDHASGYCRNYKIRQGHIYHSDIPQPDSRRDA